MSDPDSWRNDPDAPRMLLDMIESAKAVRPTITEKAELGARLGISTGGALTLPLAKWLAGSALVIGGGLALLTGLPAKNAPGEVPAPTHEVPQDSRGSSETVVVQPEPAAPTIEPISGTDQSTPNEPENGREVVSPSSKASPKSESSKEKKVLGPQLAPGKSSQPTEAQLLTAARGLIAQDPKGALRLLAQHESLYPQGILGQEREVLRVRALKQAGQLSSAEREAEEFRKAHPESAHTTNL